MLTNMSGTGGHIGQLIKNRVTTFCYYHIWNILTFSSDCGFKLFMIRKVLKFQTINIDYFEVDTNFI